MHDSGSIPIAAGIPYPTFELLLSAAVAAAAMALSTVSAVRDVLPLRTVDI